MREGFIFYVSFREAIRGLPDALQLALYNALTDYALYDKLPDFGDDGVAKGFFALMKPQIDANNRKRENGSRGGRPAKSFAQEPNDNQIETDEEPSVNQDVTKPEPKEKEKANAKVNANAKAKEKVYCADEPRRFTKPTVDEIRVYCQERGSTIDPQGFFDFYEAKGWRIGNQPMKDWQASVRTWEARESARPRGLSGGYAKHGTKPRFDQHDCTDEELSHLLVDLDADLPQGRTEAG